MAYCPNISDSNVIKEFNSIVEHFNGKPLSLDEFKDVQLRDARSGIDKTSMNLAYELWNKYAGNIEQIRNDGIYTSSNIKPGVQELFKQNSELSKIGTPQQYSKYLDTIFPDSKVKDIVYHGTDAKFQKLAAEEKAKTIEQVTKEHRSITALKDLSAKLAYRIGSKVEFVNRTDVDWKGYNQGRTSVLNEAYMTPDTPFHEILAHPIIRALKSSKIYQNLLKELETGRGKEVFEQVKRDYQYKSPYQFELDDNWENQGEAYGLENKPSIEEINRRKEKAKYTLEEQQEEAIVTLLGMMAADKLDAKKDATLISKLKELWEQISDFVKSLLLQDGIKIDELPITTTLNDLAEIMAYGNNKIILPGYKIEYSTPLGNKYDTLEEVNQEIRNLADVNAEVDLSDVKINYKKITDSNELPKQFSILIDDEPYSYSYENNQWNLYYHIGGKQLEKSDVKIDKVISDYNRYNLNLSITSFIEKNKEYEQSREIIEQWKKENNIVYDPEEVYSRGQEFYHIHNAYSRNTVDTELWIQNLLETIQDKAKIGAKVEMSFATAPKGEVGKGLAHNNKTTKQTVYITAYPDSKDIEFVSQIDNHTSSFTDLTAYTIKAFTNQKNERVGIALTKSVPLYNLNTIQPNLATTIDNVAHHNEIVIGLTPYNFRINYEENVPYHLKRLIDNVNKILDDKYGKLVKPEIKKEVRGKKYQVIIEDQTDYEFSKDIKGIFETKEEAEKLFLELDKTNPKYTPESTLRIVEIQDMGKQPTHTKGNTTSIESVKNRLNIVGEKRNRGTYSKIDKGTIVTVEGQSGEYYVESVSNLDGEIGVGITNLFYNLYPVDEFDHDTNPNGQYPLFNVPEKVIKIKEGVKKEYTSQAEINLKIAALKEVARKYPRSLITSKVVPINPNLVGNSEIQYSKVGSKQDIDGFKKFVSNYEESFLPEYTGSQLEARMSKYLVKELGAIKQEQIVNHIVNVITDAMVNNPKVNANLIRNKALKKFLDDFKEELEVLNSEEDYDGKQEHLDFYNSIINNFNTIANIVNIKLAKLNNIIEDVNDDIDLDANETQDNDKLNTGSSYEQKFKLSAEIKRLFTGVKTGKLNVIGEDDTFDYNYIYQVILENVDGIAPDFQLMMDALSSTKEAHPWIDQIVDKLKSQPVQIQNKFVTEINSHYIKHNKVLWENSKEGFKNDIQVENEGSIQDQILLDWKSNIYDSKYIDEDGFIVNKEELLSRADAIKKNKGIDKEEVRLWLQDVGIVIDDKLWQKIVNGKYKLKNREITYELFVIGKYSPISRIVDNINKIGNKSTFEYNILNDTSVKNLAKEQSKYSSTGKSMSHRAGGKSVFSFGKNKYLIDFGRELRTNNLANTILGTDAPFNSNSTILNAFKNNDEVFVENFSIETASLGAIKKHGTSEKENMELHKLNEDEYEMQVDAGLTAPIEDASGNGRRIGLFNFLTCSDKSTAMQVKMPTWEIGFNSEGELNDESIERIYESAVLPEIRRIYQWENYKKVNKEFPNKEIETFGHMFLMLPSINNIPGIWNEDGSLNVDFENKFKDAIRSEIRSVVKSKVDSKLELWKKYGFVDENMNPKTIDRRVYKDHKILEGVSKENISKAIATDIVYQYLMANTDFMTGIVGDPAHFGKSKIFKNAARVLVDTKVITKEQSKNVALVWSKIAPEQRIKVVSEVFDNVGKRLAMYIAPGKSTSNYNGTVTYLFANDRIVDSKSLEQYKALLGETEAEAYSKSGTLKEGTNAQEFTTYLEDIQIRFDAGQISQELYNEINRIVSRELSKETPNHYYIENIENELSKELKEEYDNLVYQVMKPVYSWFETTDFGITPMYIKTSSYGLNPKLTKGLDIDKIRIMMEKNKINRLSFASGTKLGMPTNPVSLWNEDGTVNENLTSEQLASAKKELPRKGFRLQQEIPYEALKDYINRVSQADKNLFINMLNVEGFEYEGKKYTGAELQKLYEKYYGELYQLGYNELIDELEVKFDDFGNVATLNREKLKKLLLEEATKRDYALNDIEALDLDDALNYIAFMPSAVKYEALLNAIVKNRILQMKFRGKSFVLSTEEGYQKQKSVAFEDLKDKSGIVYTDKWTGELDPGHFEDINGKKLTGDELRKAIKEGTAIVKKPAQILIPWKFQWNKKLLHIEDFINPETGRIDTSKLPEELLHIFGMRIPNQGPNSQSWVEIVGFLPKKSGDIVVATRDYLAQMGSDFDVDKLYTYMYNYFYDGDKLEKINFNSRSDIEKLGEDTLKNLIFQTEEDSYVKYKEQAKYLDNVNQVWRQSLQNKLLDIHIAIHKNPDIRVQKQIYEPLGFWKFKDIADNIADNIPVDMKFTAMSDEYQRTKRINAGSGKQLVGDFANGLMFISVAQGKNLYLQENKLGGDPHRVHVRFGKRYSDGDLSGEYTLKTIANLITTVAKHENISPKDVSAKIDTYIKDIHKYLKPEEITYRSAVMNGLSSSALDNEKEQILDKLFLNGNTSKYAKLLAFLGFEEEVAYFTRQPIIVDYFNEIARLTSTLAGYNPNAKEKALEFVKNKYKTKEFSTKEYEDNYEKGKGLSLSNLKESILNPNKSPNFNYIQIAAIEQLEYLDKYASAVQSIQSLINTDSKGLDKSLLETISKEDNIGRLYMKPIANVESLLNNTINGFSTEYGLKFNNKLWSKLFPYQQQGIGYMFEKIESILGKDEVGTQTKASLRNNIWKSFKSYLFTLNEFGLFDNLESERRRLFSTEDNNVTLAKKIKKLKTLPLYINHPFISRLNPDISKGLPNIVKMDAGLDQVNELLIIQSAIDLYVNDVEIPEINTTTRELFKDLFKAAYISGGVQEAQQYLRFMPVSYLYDIGFTNKVSVKVVKKAFEDSTFLGIPHEDAPYWQLPPFVVQYFQHDTKGLPSLGENYSSKIISLRNQPQNSTNVKTVEFALKDTENFNLEFPPVLLTVPSKEGRIRGLDKNVLFIFQGRYTQDGYPIYDRIPNYGSKFFKEYSFNNNYTKSLINSYNSEGIVKMGEGKFRNDTSISEEFDNVLTKISPREWLQIPDNGNIDDIKNILNNIITEFNDIRGELAKELLLNSDKISDVKLDSTYSEESKRGKLSNNTVYLNMNIPTMQSVDAVVETFNHEILHAYINKIFASDASKLTPDTRAAIADLRRLHSIFTNRIKTKYGDKYEEIVNKVKTGKVSKEDFQTKTEFWEVYATTDEREFMTLAMTNENMQRSLNNIDDPNFKERSLLDKFVDVIEKLLKSIGFDIKDGSMLDSAIRDSIVLIKDTNFIEPVSETQTSESYMSEFISEEDMLKSIGELDSNGRAKKYFTEEKDTDNNKVYKQVLNKAVVKNKQQLDIFCSVGKHYQGNKLAYYVKVRKTTPQEKFARISNEEVMKNIRKCR